MRETTGSMGSIPRGRQIRIGRQYGEDACGSVQPLSQTNGFFLSAIVFLCKYTVDGQVELCYNKSTIGTGSGGGEEDARRIKKRNLLPFSFPCSVTVFLLFQRCRFLLCFQEKRSKRGVPPGAAGGAAPVGCGDENK